MHYLTMHQETTAPFLAAKLEVSIRTIYRDIDELSAQGFPVYAQNGRNGGIRLLENHQLSATFVTKEEQDTILSGLENLAVTDFESTDELSQKLSSLFKRYPEPWVVIDYSGWGKEEQRKSIQLLTSARKNENCVFLTYENSRGITSKREVAPNKLFFKQHDWYLSGYCYLKEDYRIFKLKRIKALELSERKLDLSLLTEEYLPQYTYEYVEFFLAADHLPRLKEELSNLVVSPEGERFRISTYQGKGEWLFTYLLSYGAAIEVIAPVELRNRLVEEVKKYNRLYLDKE